MNLKKMHLFIKFLSISLDNLKFVECRKYNFSLKYSFCHLGPPHGTPPPLPTCYAPGHRPHIPFQQSHKIRNNNLDKQMDLFFSQNMASSLAIQSTVLTISLRSNNTPMQKLCNGQREEKIKDSERVKLHQKTLPQDWNVTLTTMASTEQCRIFGCSKLGLNWEQKLEIYIFIYTVQYSRQQPRRDIWRRRRRQYVHPASSLCQ